MAAIFDRFGAAALLALGLAGCARGGDFPSLTPRPGERDIALEEPVRTAPSVASEAALRARAQQFLDEARRGDRAFEAAYRPARAASARAGAAGSESWVAAQQAISRAEAARAETIAAVSELDRLVIERAASPTDSQDFAAVTAAAAEAAAIAERQQARLAALRASLRSG